MEREDHDESLETKRLKRLIHTPLFWALGSEFEGSPSIINSITNSWCLNDNQDPERDKKSVLQF